MNLWRMSLRFQHVRCAPRQSLLAGGANEFQAATTIGAEIELSHFRMSCATAGIDCAAKSRYLFFSFFKTCSTHQKKSEMTASLNDPVCQGQAVGNSPQVPYSYLHFFFSHRVDTLYSRTRAQF
jgi:hypothetical protein